MTNDNYDNNPGNKQQAKPVTKASLGGAFNSGVTSSNRKMKDQIEKKASMLKVQPKGHDEEKFKGLTPGQHALIDYALVGGLMLLPKLLRLPKAVQSMYAVEGLSLLTYVALTKHPYALKPVIPFKRHCEVDKGNIAGFAMQTFSTPIRKDKRSIVFNVLFTCVATAVVLLTKKQD